MCFPGNLLPLLCFRFGPGPTEIVKQPGFFGLVLRAVRVLAGHLHPLLLVVGRFLIDPFLVRSTFPRI